MRRVGLLVVALLACACHRSVAGPPVDDGGGPPGSSISFPQTLRAASGRVGAFITGPLPDGVSTVNNAATAAQLKDGSDATYDELTGTGDGVTAPNNTSYAVDWNIDPIVGSGTIPRVRVTIRATANGTTDGGAAQFVRPRINGITRGAVHSLLPAGNVTDFTDEFTTDPGTGLPWTAATVASYKWGFIEYIEGADVANGPVTSCRVTEFKVELITP